MRSTCEMIIHSRETIGDVPPELIGASTTLAGSKFYLFGGSLPFTPEPKPVADLYVLDLELWKWEKLQPAVEDRVPTARCFHTIDIWNNHLVVFGGLGKGSDAGQLQNLNDVQLFNISTRRWLQPPGPRAPAVASSVASIPRPRHAHLSCVSVNQFFVIGGRDTCGETLTDVCVYDLGKQEWISRQQYFPTVDIDHAFVATSQWHIRPSIPDLPRETDCGLHATPLSYSELATDKSPCDIYVYNVGRVFIMCYRPDSSLQADRPQPKLDVLHPLSDGQIQKERLLPPVAVPSLRFPSGAILGNTLIVAGNNSADDAEHAFSIWTLDLETRTSVCIGTGDLLKNGSWAKGFLWHEQNKLFVFGKAGGSFTDTTEQRMILGWDAVTVVNLEALGIYLPPTLKLDNAARTLGLASLAGGQQADFAFVCDDGRRIPCSRKILLDRWPWFQEQHAQLGSADDSRKHQKRMEMIIMQTSLTLSQSYPVAMALLQYFYSLALDTALQRAPAVLSYLLLISTEFHIPYLRALVTHAMHVALTQATAEGVYEIAASCGLRSLQIR
ncbi:galactose oxidase, partial [Mycena sanguinolenta]